MKIAIMYQDNIFNFLAMCKM